MAYNGPMSEGPDKRRRWFAFRLRTLFLAIAAMCLVLGWIAWNLQQLRQRERVRQYLVLCRCRIEPGTSNRPWKSLPIMWSMLGAEPVRLIELSGVWVKDEDRPHIEFWFPEADILDVRPPQR